ncbi:fibronectin type III domain-containing protein [Gorillibacterium sp. CAU 1737]|uniref:fibronectin type III domain-containing protein n=1 Tax=Gorillibacterium sp. CAU 1737 TaxID=3140362 RepID=UPI003261A67E
MAKKYKVISALIVGFVLSFSLLTLHASAASIGQQLTQAESGWIRYDDSNSLIYYSGMTSESHASTYQNTYHYGGYPFTNKSIKFNFVGTKLRIIDANNSLRVPNGMKITIDGVSEVYSSYSPTYNYQVLSYEKVGLPKGIHEVVIEPVAEVNGSENFFSLDAIDIDESGYLVSNAPNNLIASVNGKIIDLSWTEEAKATSYNVKRSTTPGGPYTDIASGIKGHSFSDTTVSSGVTYYYVVTSVTEKGESKTSNEVSVAIEASGKAILTITLDNGSEKEYDLSMSEVNAFINWYEAKAAGTGTASFAIDKHNNNKGPFKSRKEYVIFNKIVSFEVNEYEVTN